MPFPTTSVLDSFVRANEDPLANGNWTGPVEDPGAPGKNQLRIVSNVATGRASGTSQGYWSAASFGASQEAYVTLVNKFTTGSIYLWLNLQSPGTSGIDGYFAGIFNDGSDKTGLYRVTNGGGFNTIYEVATTINNGDSFGVQNIAGTFQAYRKPSGGSWGPVASATGVDTTYGAGFIGLGADRDVETLSNFGGGTYVPGGSDARAFLIGGDLLGPALLNTGLVR